MDLTTRGAFRLFQVAGIDVYLHWSWFLIALWQINLERPPNREYQVAVWKVAEYISLFAIVLLHEFGHAVACRSVGGHADRIVLWPLGGIAYVAPPPRPGAVLWSIVGGPLVNVLLILPLGGLYALGHSLDWATTMPDLNRFVEMMAMLNVLLLVLNLVPVYPLDGGQILQALLWYPLGRWISLQIVGVLGIVLGGTLFLTAIFFFLYAGALGEGGASLMGGLVAIIALFIILRSFIAFQQARLGLSLMALPRHDDCACPSCGVAPPHGNFWVCDHCQTRFDLFDAHGKCSACGAWYLHPDCIHCRQKSHIDRWFDPALPPESRSEPAPEAPQTEA